MNHTWGEVTMTKEAFDKAIADAIAAERERCARIAEGHVPPTEAAKTTDWAVCIRDANLASRIAAAIRAGE